MVVRGPDNRFAHQRLFPRTNTTRASSNEGRTARIKEWVALSGGVGAYTRRSGHPRDPPFSAALFLLCALCAPDKNKYYVPSTYVGCVRR